MNQSVISPITKPISKNHITNRIYTYIAVFILTIVSYFYLSLSISSTSSILTNNTGLIAGVLAALVSSMALIKYLTRIKPMYLLISIGSLGFFLLTASSTYLWTNHAAQTIMAICYCLSLLPNYKPAQAKLWLFKPFVLHYLFAVLSLILIPILSYSLSPLTGMIRIIYYLLPFALLVFALIGYLTKKFWHFKFFEHWLVISIIFTATWNGLLSVTNHPLPGLINIYTIISLTFLLIGLLMSMYAAFVEIEFKEKTINAQYEQLISTQDLLRIERDRASLIISSMAEGLLVIDSNYMIELINPIAEKLLDISKNEAIGEQWSHLVNAYSGDMQIPFKDRTSIIVLNTGRTIVTKMEDDHYYQTRSGSKFSVSSITAPLINSNQEIVGAVKVFRDATKERFTKQEIERQVVVRTKQLVEAQDRITEGWVQVQMEKARLKASIDSLTLGFIMTDKKLDIITQNPAINKILGPSAGKNWTIANLDAKLKDQIEITKACQDCLDKNTIFETDKLSVNNKFISIFISPIESLEKKNQIIGLVILLEDVTEAKLLDRTKDEFFAVASHELRTPLSAIKGNIEIIQDHFKSALKDKDVASMMDDIHQSTVRLTKIVNDFLDVSRLEQNQIDSDLEEFDVATVIKDCIKEIMPDFTNKNLTLNSKPEKLPTTKVFADQAHTKQIIINLLSNASKYTRHGGAVVSLVNDKNKVKVSITDTGLGIPEANLKFLFRKFFQATDNLLTREATQGTGLGLYISKKLANQMKSDVVLTNTTKDKGSTFTLVLPKPDLVKAEKIQ